MIQYKLLGAVPERESSLNITDKIEVLLEDKSVVERYVNLLMERFPFVADKFSYKIFSTEIGWFYEALFLFQIEDEDERLIAQYIQEHLPKYWTEKRVYNIEDMNRREEMIEEDIDDYIDMDDYEYR